MEPTSKPVVLGFPMPGACVAKRPPGHHPLALDLMGLDRPDGRTSTASSMQWLMGRTTVDRYDGWGRPLYAPGRGVIVTVSDGRDDRPRTGLLNTVAVWVHATFIFRPSIDEGGQPDIAPNVGNHVMIGMDGGGIAFYAHLQNGSTEVAVGDAVHDQTMLGLVGNSGNTTAPHLHVHVLDQHDDLMSAQLVPFVFSTYERWNGSRWSTERHAIPEPGQVVRAPTR